VFVLVLALVECGIYALYAQKPVSGSAMEFMNQRQAMASICVEEQANLRTYRYGLRVGEANPSDLMCYHQFYWRLPPDGWAYDVVEDADVSDGTFTFSVRNRRGEHIVCTEHSCTFVPVPSETR